MSTDVSAGICLLKGRTGPLQQVPKELQAGTHLLMGKGRVSLWIGTCDQNTMLWKFGIPAPEAKAVELNAIFKDPVAAQVRFEPLATCHACIAGAECTESNGCRLGTGWDPYLRSSVGHGRGCMISRQLTRIAIVDPIAMCCAH